MKVLVTGADGQLGRELQLSSPMGFDLIALDRGQLDITRENQIDRIVREIQPDIIINAAAYTAVDRAEQERELAVLVNDTGVAHLARRATQAGTRLIHLSTDFVFNGEQARPYLPESSTDPQCAYGASKLAGEQHLLRISGHRGLVLRTSWVYSRFGNNFVKTLLRLLREREEISVVMDQIGCPTWARSLANAIWAACDHPEISGIYHWTDSGVASWYDFAIAIQEEADGLDLLQSTARVLPVSSDQFPTAARRPPFSVLDTTATRDQLNLPGLHWRTQLRTMLRDLKENGEE